MVPPARRGDDASQGAAVTPADDELTQAFEEALKDPAATPGNGNGAFDPMKTARIIAAASKSIPPLKRQDLEMGLDDWAERLAGQKPEAISHSIAETIDLITPVCDDAGAEIKAALERAGLLPQESLTRIYTPAELFALQPETVDWVCWPYIAKGDVVSFESPPKDGKTTFVLSLVAAVASHGRFLDQQTQGGPVLYCTEERGGTFSDVLKRVGAGACEDLRIMLLHESAWRLSWLDIVAEITRHAQEISAALVVIDTLAKWAGMHGDDEQSAGVAMTTMTPLQHLASKGIGVAVIRHERKSGGAVGQAGRGSSAFTGEMDTIIAVRRMAGEKTKRMVAAVGRHDETPEETIVEFDAGTFRNLGDPADLQRMEQEREVIDNLQYGEGGAVTIAVASGSVSRRATERILGRLIREGVVRRGQMTSERGQHAYGYWLQGDND